MSCSNCSHIWNIVLGEDNIIAAEKTNCLSCENKQRYNNLPAKHKILINTYEKLLINNNPSSMTALKEMMELGIDDIHLP
tara:strand:- start:81 stop:320 length:240 start_codon:yes stop_codon:yes gene_type:complete